MKTRRRLSTKHCTSLSPAFVAQHTANALIPYMKNMAVAYRILPDGLIGWMYLLPDPSESLPPIPAALCGRTFSSIWNPCYAGASLPFPQDWFSCLNPHAAEDKL